MADKFLDRDLSALEFNARVLAEGMDPTNPLMERFKFIGIVSSNLDEFFMVRVASLRAADAPQESAVRKKAQALIDTRNAYFFEKLLPELEAAGLVRQPPETCTPNQLEFLTVFFHKEILPVLTPIALQPDLPMPMLTNLRPHVLVTLAKPEALTQPLYAVIEIPQRPFPRMIFLPSEKGRPFVLLEELIAAFVTELFPGHEIQAKSFFRITRGAELTFDEEKDEDFMQVMTEALRERRTGDIVRLEVSTVDDGARFLKKHLGVEDAALVENRGWLDLKNASQIAFQPGFETLQRPSWDPRPVPEIEQSENLWKTLQEKDVLLMHPYQSFDAVLHFLETAADDPDVLAIKQTLYRTDRDSPVLRALLRAAEKGKRVTALIELKARFDEQNNIEWARRLMAAGVSVLYGVAGYKTHAKACLVIRREPGGIRRYTHLSTGNYNERTAQIYSDIGLLTSSEELGSDLSSFFNMITGYSQPAVWSKIEVAPYGLRRKLLRLIRRETLRHTAQRPGLIRAKMNSLVDPELMEALYKASQTGVRIELNVRGICGLRPGVKGLSETIQVTSIVDMFLEHSRIFYFQNGGEAEVYLASADWMPRNLDRRIELMFPVDNPPLKKKLIETLDTYFRDNVKAWSLRSDGSYLRVDAGSRKKFRAQEALCQRALDDEQLIRRAAPQALEPQRPRLEPSVKLQ